MSNEHRLERLTREAIGPAKRKTYTQLDDRILRAVGIIILIVTVVTFASWPREDDSERRPAKSGDAGGAATRTAEYTPIHRIG